MTRLTLAAFLGLLTCTAPALAQKFGYYEGTASVAYSTKEGGTTYEYVGAAKIRIPLTSVTADYAMAELDDNPPAGTITLTTFNYKQVASSKGADGKYMEVTCKLAAPTEVPVTASGNLSVDYRKKEYTMFLVLTPSKEMPVNCVNSQSGPYKAKKGAGLIVASFVPQGTMKLLPFTDKTRLSISNYSLVDPALKDHSPIVQSWDLKYVK
ncbi:hypothetical protein [Usitatibacter palustris]|uniref:DUF3108 domain-containing protein n=1 Tax=Usitatibacter palustris TaxID=2732487 RepID=A0A6M4H6F3_9PROT|nr:hypothetical protein [Usitatibacter palustris]QJR14922.1 hypothetical protein DSM104440_01737 [Usitatibacter palustris]